MGINDLWSGDFDVFQQDNPPEKPNLGCAISDEPGWPFSRIAVGWWAAQPGKTQHFLKPRIRSLENCVCSFFGTCWEKFQVSRHKSNATVQGSKISTVLPCFWSKRIILLWNFQRNNLGLRRWQICRKCVSNKTSWQVFEHRLAEAINRLRETLDELTVQKKGIKPLGLLEGKMKKQIQSKGHVVLSKQGSCGFKVIYRISAPICDGYMQPRWWFRRFSNLYLYSGNDSRWRIFFKLGSSTITKGDMEVTNSLIRRY